MFARRYKINLRVFNLISIWTREDQFLSPSNHVLFCLFYKHTNNEDFVGFPKISDHFPNISEDVPNVVRRSYERFRTFSEMKYVFCFPNLPCPTIFLRIMLTLFIPYLLTKRSSSLVLTLSQFRWSRHWAATLRRWPCLLHLLIRN